MILGVRRSISVGMGVSSLSVKVSIVSVLKRLRINNSPKETSMSVSGTKRSADAMSTGPSSRVRVHGATILGQELRQGIIQPESYDKLFVGNTDAWRTLGGCPLGSRESVICDEENTFNFFGAGANPEIEWSDVDDTVVQNTIGTVGEGAEIRIAKLPYLAHPQTFKRPTLFMFSVTGHVMLAVYFNGVGRGSELHILNPWPLKFGMQQFNDVYTLLKTIIPKDRGIRIVDIADQVQIYAKSLAGKEVPINLQENERLGFCTLWVGILATALLTTKPRKSGSKIMSVLQNQVVNAKHAAGYQLSPIALDIYYTVYTNLIREREELIKQATATFGPDSCEATAAFAATQMAKRAAVPVPTGGRTYRKRKHVSSTIRKTRWTRKHRVRK